jgi:hypothetical protein
VKERRNKITIRNGFARSNPTEELSQESWWVESTRGSIVLTGTVESYNGTSKIAYVNHRAGETVKALNLSGVSLSNGDEVSYMLDDTGDYAVLGKKP